MIRKSFILFLGILAGGLARAADPPQGSLRLFIPFTKSGGLFKYLKSDQMPDNNARSVNNLDYSIDGLMRSRHTIKAVFDLTFSQTPSANINESIVDGTLKNIKQPQNDYFIIYHATTGFNYFVSKVEDQIDIIENENALEIPIQIQLSTGSIDAIETNGDLFIVNEVSPIIKITEISQSYVDPNLVLVNLKKSYIPGSPSGNILKTHLDRYLVAGSTVGGQQNTLIYSSGTTFDGADIYSWPPENTIELFAQSNERITCIGDAVFGNVPIYTNFTSRLLTGSDYGDDITPGNINVRMINGNVGCSSQKSVKNLRNKQYFYFSGEGGQWPGIYEFNGVGVKEKTAPIRSFFRDEVQNSTATLHTAYTYKDKYCLNVATNSFDRLNTVVCVDETDRIWMYRPFIPSMMDTLNGASYFVSYFALMDKNKIGASGDTGARYSIYRYDVDDLLDIIRNVPIPISWTYKTKDFPIGDENMSRQKVPERVYFKTESTTYSCIVQVQANFDFGKSSMTWLVDPSTFYSKGSIITVSSATGNVLNRLYFPTGKSNLDFNNINFEVSGSSKVQIDYIDAYFGTQALK